MTLGTIQSEAPVAVARGASEQLLRRFRRDKVGLVAAAALIVLVFAAVIGAPLAAMVTGHAYDQQLAGGLDMNGIPLAPLSHELAADGTPDPNGDFLILGTDRLGRDTLVRLLYGARISLIVAFTATAVALLIGVPLGLAAGYYGGMFDRIVSRAIDTAMAFPALLFAVGLAAVIGPGLLNVIIVIALFSWYYPARLVRSSVLSLKHQQFIEASISVGARDGRIMLRHLLPQLVAPIIVYATGIIALNILFEAGLSFLGLGVPPPEPSWGQLLADGVANGLYRVMPWVAVVPGVALVLTTLAFNLLGDSLRDAFAPRAGLDVIRFIVRRLAIAIVQVLIVTLIAYLLFYVVSALTGADPAQRVAGRAASPEQVAQVAHLLGTDRPWYEQYGKFLVGVLQGDFGYSFQQRIPVAELLWPAAGVTVGLVLGAAVLWMLVAVPVGLIGALRPRTARDRVSSILVQVAISAPVFWVAPMIAYLFGYLPSQGILLGFHIPPVTLFPIQGFIPLLDNPAGWADSMFLPWIALALGFAAFYARFVRAFVLEQLGEDYVLVARAKGASTAKILRSHIAPIVAPAIITFLALDVGAALGGALFVEVTFGLPGLGFLAFSSIQNLDYPLTVAVVTFAALMAVLANTLADIAQAALDPRVRI